MSGKFRLSSADVPLDGDIEAWVDQLCAEHVDDDRAERNRAAEKIFDVFKAFVLRMKLRTVKYISDKFRVEGAWVYVPAELLNDECSEIVLHLANAKVANPIIVRTAPELYQARPRTMLEPLDVEANIRDLIATMVNNAVDLGYLQMDKEVDE